MTSNMPPVWGCGLSSTAMPSGCISAFHLSIGLALCPVRGTVAAAASIATAWLLGIVAVVHGLGLLWVCGALADP